MQYHTNKLNGKGRFPRPASDLAQQSRTRPATRRAQRMRQNLPRPRKVENAGKPLRRPPTSTDLGASHGSWAGRALADHPRRLSRPRPRGVGLPYKMAILESQPRSGGASALFPQRLAFSPSAGKADARTKDFDPERGQLGVGDHQVCNVGSFRKLKPRLFGFQDFEAFEEKN